MRPEANLFKGKPSIDLCGTGGDRLELINVSTTASFIVAAAGAAVVKHGNRAITSRSGGADVLEKLGIPVTSSPEKMIAALEQTGVGFYLRLYFIRRSVRSADARKKAGRTRNLPRCFNLLGPLLNPLRPEYRS